jgi:1,4-dihydroxy-2-naphthoate octaprenyltransferase
MATPAQWIEGARPRTFPAAVSPVVVGTGVAVFEHQAVWWKALLALVVSLALQVAVNYANDYSDGVRGTDEGRVGPMRLVGSKAAAPSVVKAAAFVSFGVAAAAGLVLAVATAWWLVVVGLACMVAAWYYTGGRSRFGFHGLGEVLVFLFFGLVAVLGTTYVQTLAVPWPAWLGAIGTGTLASAILVANNLRDIPTDEIAGKRTLAVLLGDRRSRLLFALLLVVGAATVVGLMVGSTWWAVLGLAFLAAGLPAARSVLDGATGRELIPVLQGAGVAELLYAVGLFVGLLVGSTAG